MLGLRWTVAGVLLLIWMLFAVLNAATLATVYIKKKHVSMLPLIGGLAGVLGCVALPVGPRAFLGVGAFMLDWGSGPLLLNVLLHLLFDRSYRDNFRS